MFNYLLFLKSSSRRDLPPVLFSPTPLAPLLPGLPTKFGKRELLDPKTPFAVRAGTALVLNFASAPGAAETRFAPPTRPPKEPPIDGGGVNDNPKGLGDAVTVPVKKKPKKIHLNKLCTNHLNSNISGYEKLLCLIFYFIFIFYFI